MDNVLVVFLKIMPIILLLLLGVWMRKSHFVSADVISGIKKITLNIAIPSILFTTFFRADMTQEMLMLAAVTFAACLTAFGLGFLIKRQRRSTNPYLPALFTTFLTGPVGFPLFSFYFGEENLYKLAILDAGHSIFLFTVLIAFMGSAGTKGTVDGRKNLWVPLCSMLRSPMTIAMIAGIALSFSGYAPMIEGYPAGAAALGAVDLAASSAFSLSLILVGYELPLRVKKLGRTLADVLLRLGMMLLIAYVLNTVVIAGWLGLDKTYQMALYTMFLLPPSFIIPLSITEQSEEKQYVMGFISLHLVVSMAAFILLMAVI